MTSERHPGQGGPGRLRSKWGFHSKSGGKALQILSRGLPQPNSHVECRVRLGTTGKPAVRLER